MPRNLPIPDLTRVFARSASLLFLLASACVFTTPTMGLRYITQAGDAIWESETYDDSLVEHLAGLERGPQLSGRACSFLWGGFVRPPDPMDALNETLQPVGSRYNALVDARHYQRVHSWSAFTPLGPYWCVHLEGTAAVDAPFRSEP